MENPFFEPPSGWDTDGGYLRGHLSFVRIFVSMQNLTSDFLPTWSISRGLGAVENSFFDPPLGWQIVGGYPRGHLSFVRIFDSIENFNSDYLLIWSISRGLGAVENPFFDPPSGCHTDGGYPKGHLNFVRIFVSMQNLTSDFLPTWSISGGPGAVENPYF